MFYAKVCQYVHSQAEKGTQCVFNRHNNRKQQRYVILQWYDKTSFWNIYRMNTQLRKSNILSEHACPTRLAYCCTVSSSLGPFRFLLYIL